MQTIWKYLFNNMNNSFWWLSADSRYLLTDNPGNNAYCELAFLILQQAEKLISCRIHPQTIITGYRKAVKVAEAALAASAKDNSANPDQFREDLMNIARTTLSSKILTQHKDKFSKLAVDAVLRLKVGSGYCQYAFIVHCCSTIARARITTVDLRMMSQELRWWSINVCLFLWV